MSTVETKKRQEVTNRRDAPLLTPSDLRRIGTKDIAGAMNAILADVFALYVKTKNFHWHMSGPHFRDYHLLLDEQADQLSRAVAVYHVHPNDHLRLPSRSIALSRSWGGSGPSMTGTAPASHCGWHRGNPRELRHLSAA